MEGLISKGLSLFGEVAKIVAEKPIAGLSMIGTLCIVLFYVSGMFELQSKKIILYLTLLFL